MRYGQKHTASAKKKVAAARRGKTHSPETKAKIAAAARRREEQKREDRAVGSKLVKIADRYKGGSVPALFEPKESSVVKQAVEHGVDVAQPDLFPEAGVETRLGVIRPSA